MKKFLTVVGLLTVIATPALPSRTTLTWAPAM